MQHDECKKALLRIFPKINLKDIFQFIQSIPDEYNGITIMNQKQKEFYYKSIVYKYEKVFKPIYEKIINK